MGQRGPKPGSGGRPKKPIADKIADGNPGKRPLTVIDFKDSAADLEGQPMPKPSEFLSAKQRDGGELQAKEIYTETWQWLKKIGCTAIVSPQLIERYAVCAARWIQCEEMTNQLGMLGRHPTTGKPIPSPFINIGIQYMNQAIRQWNEIYQIVKDNCTVDYSGANPQDDLMERLLNTRRK